MTEHYKGRVAWETINHFELNFNLGNVVKYVCRAEQKGGIEDLAKAKTYLDDEIRKWEQREERQAKQAEQEQRLWQTNQTKR